MSEPIPTQRQNARRSIRLLAPGCFSELQTEAHAEAETVIADPMAAEVQPTELNRCSVQSTDSRSYEQALYAGCALAVPDLGNIPAAFCSLNAGSESDIHVVCADPVHLLADTVNARLIPAEALDISELEADKLIESLNSLLNADGIGVQKASAGRWFLSGMPAGALDTWPSHAVANGKIAGYLPRGKAAANWRRLMTEVQMLFHEHPVNEQRAAIGKLPVNAVWFWGGASMPPERPGAPVLLFADDPFSQGFATAMGLQCATLDKFELNNAIAGASPPVSILIDLSAYHAWLSGDSEKLKLAKQLLQSRWIEPFQQAVASNRIDEFVLDGCEGHAIAETALEAEPQNAPALVRLINRWRRKPG